MSGRIQPESLNPVGPSLVSSLPIFLDYPSRCIYSRCRICHWKNTLSVVPVMSSSQPASPVTFEGTSAGFNKFFKATNFPFPVLESLVLRLGFQTVPIANESFEFCDSEWCCASVTEILWRVDYGRVNRSDTSTLASLVVTINK